MGAIAEAMVKYTQCLLDETDGSDEQVQTAFALGQACWNLAVMPPDKREEMHGKMQTSMKMNDDEYAKLRHGVIEPMIRRHEEMFPALHGRRSAPTMGMSGTPFPQSPSSTPREGPRAGRNDPCPCGSGRKYKHCCGG